MAVVETFRNREGFPFGNTQIAADQSARRVDAVDSFKSQQQTSAMGAHGRHTNFSLLGTARPQKEESRNETFGEGSQRFDRELALQAMRAPNEADQEK
jgi:hypothetical protein